MDFNEAWRLYTDLKGQFDQGRISAEDLERRVNEIAVTDSKGNPWQIGVKTGKWYRLDGQNWVEAAPPSGDHARIQSAAPSPRSIEDGQGHPPGRGRTWLWIGGGLGILALLACVAVVLVFFVFNRADKAPDVIAGPAPSVQKLTNTPQADSSSPLVGQTALPGFDPSAVYFDDFSNPGSGWDQEGDNDGITNYENGQYRISVTTTSMLMWATAHKNFNGDVNIEVDATKAAGPDDNQFGVICRYQDPDNFYRFLISSDGYAVIASRKNGEARYLSADKMQPSDAILQGEATNHIRVSCIGSDLSLSINGREVARVTDTSFTSGDVGLLAGTFANTGVDILFDNFSASAR